jgi:arylformamidase
MSEHRAVFDFHISFTNGGALDGTGFRLDVPGRGMNSEEVGRLLVRGLGLLMTGSVELKGLTIVEEPHRGSPRAEEPRAGVRRLVELSHAIVHGMTTYPGLPPPVMSDHLTREVSEELYGPGVQFQIGRLSMVGNTGTYVR